MVQRKVPNKLGIQADHHFHHVKSDKRLANFSQDGKTRGGADMKKKMKKPRTIKLSHVEVLKSPPPPKKNFSLHVHHPTTNVSCSSPQKMTPLIRTNDGSPNYMKSTSSSNAKKELFPVSIRNSKPSNSKSSSYVSAKKPAKALAKSSPSLKLVRTLTKAPSFKKSSRLSLCAADVNNAQRATCSSTLKDSKFPPYLMLNPGATESEGTSAMKVCPYTYCSLNGHHHAPLPPLKSFLSARRRILKTQKSMKQEALSPRKLKVPSEPKKESDTGDMDFFIEIYAKKNGEEENIKHIMEENNFVTQEYYGIDDMKQVVASLSDGSPKSEIDSEEDYGKYIDDVKIEADLKGGFIQEQEAEFAGEKHVPMWSGEELSIGSCCSEISNEGEILEGSDTEATDMEWEHVEDDDDTDADSSVLTEENDSKVELLSESSHDVSVKWLDDIIDIYYEDIVAEVSQKSNAKGSYCFDSQHDGINCDMEGKDENLENQEGNETVHSSNSPEKTFEELVETEVQYQQINDVLGEENLMNKESLNLENDEADCISSIHNSTLDGQEDTSLKQDDSSMSHAYQIPYPPLAETNNRMEDKVGDCTSDAYQDYCEDLKVHSSQGQKVSGHCETDKISEEENNSTNKWKGYERRKRAVEDEDEMRKFNPREPNFLPLVPDPEAEKVDLKHQMMDERKNAEEWMVDYALRQTVSKLAPARKRKVALLVEAFESVTPIPKYESHMRNRSSFAHPRPIQACR